MEDNLHQENKGDDSASSPRGLRPSPGAQLLAFSNLVFGGGEMALSARRYLRDHPGAIERVPSSVLGSLSPKAKPGRISAVLRVLEANPTAAARAGSALVGLLRHPEADIAISAARILAGLGAHAEIAFVPIAVMDASGLMQAREVVHAFEQELHQEEGLSYLHCSDAVGQFLRLREDKRLRQFAECVEGQWQADEKGRSVVLAALCASSQSLRKEALKVLATHDFGGTWTIGGCQVEAALGYVIPDVLLPAGNSDLRQLLVSAASNLRSSAHLGALFERAAGDFEQAEMPMVALRLLSASAAILPAEDKGAPIKRIIQGLWDPAKAASREAASSLVALSEALPERLRSEAVGAMFDSLVAMYGQAGSRLEREILASNISSMRGCDRQIFEGALKLRGRLEEPRGTPACARILKLAMPKMTDREILGRTKDLLVSIRRRGAL